MSRTGLSPQYSVDTRWWISEEQPSWRSGWMWALGPLMHSWSSYWWKWRWRGGGRSSQSDTEVTADSSRERNQGWPDFWCWFRSEMHLIICKLHDPNTGNKIYTPKLLIWSEWAFDWENVTPEIDKTWKATEKRSHSVGIVGTVETLSTLWLCSGVTEWRFFPHKQSLMSTDIACREHTNLTTDKFNFGPSSR